MTDRLIKKERLPELDSLRGLAALSVILFHFTYGYDYGQKNIDPSKFYFTYGRMGVQLFFLISGFVIFMTLEKTKTIADFIVSRFSRLYPTYWASILIIITITLLIAPPLQESMYNLKQVLVNFSMCQYLFKVKDVDGAYWTLFVELSFYMVMGIIFSLNKMKHIFWICIFWLNLSVVFYFFEIPFGKYFKVLLLLRYAPLFIGGIGFYLLKNENILRNYILIISSLICYLLIFQEVKPSNTEMTIVLFIYMVMYFFVLGKLKFLVLKPLLFLGTISYPMYLIHENVGSSIIYWLKKITDTQIFYLPITILIVVLIAYLINKYIEKHSIQYIRDFYKLRFSPAQD